MGFGKTVSSQTSAPVAETKTEHKGNGPVKKYKYGGVTLDKWVNDGQHSKFDTFSLQRSYMKDNKFQNTTSLRTQDLPKAILALQDAYREALLSEQEDKE